MCSKKEFTNQEDFKQHPCLKVCLQILDPYALLLKDSNFAMKLFKNNLSSVSKLLLERNNKDLQELSLDLEMSNFNQE